MNDKNLSNLRDIESNNWWKKEREKYSGLKKKKKIFELSIKY